MANHVVNAFIGDEKTLYSDLRLYEGSAKSTLVTNPISRNSLAGAHTDVHTELHFLFDQQSGGNSGDLSENLIIWLSEVLVLLESMVVENSSDTGSELFDVEFNFDTDEFNFADGVADDAFAAFANISGSRFHARFDDNPNNASKGQDTIFGGKGSDIIFGGKGSDIIFGGNGHDTIYGGKGQDIIFGGNGHDTIYGGKGQDTVFGGNGHDTIFGGKGSDILFGGNGHDTIYGGKGDDVILGGKGDDVIFGGKGDDIIFGGKGDDVIFGGKGDDLIYGGNGQDTINGGKGCDIVVFDGDQCDYEVENLGNGNWTIKSSNGDINTLSNIEILQFDDGDLFVI